MNVHEPQRAEDSLGSLFSQLTSDLSALVRDEIQLARVEVTEDLGRASRAGAMLGGAAGAAVIAIVVVSFAAAWGLAEVMPAGFAFLIVGIIWSVVALALFVIGRDRMRDTNVKPEQTIETMQENIQWVKQQKS
jgi:hypothetical protein